MDHKKSPIRRQKRSSKVLEENFWDCSVCTYRNTAEAFKCLMCDVRKGTSTRKPRLNSALVAQQAATLPGAPTTSSATATTAAAASMANGSSTGGGGASSHAHHAAARPVKVARGKAKHKKYPARLTNVDRSTAQTREVTVNSVTVVITEYKPKAKPSRRESSEQSLSESNDSRS